MTTLQILCHVQMTLTYACFLLELLHNPIRCSLMVMIAIQFASPRVVLKTISGHLNPKRRKTTRSFVIDDGTIIETCRKCCFDVTRVAAFSRWNRPKKVFRRGKGDPFHVEIVWVSMGEQGLPHIKTPFQQGEEGCCLLAMFFSRYHRRYSR